MSSATVDELVAFDSPLDVVDMLLSTGGAVGVLLYVGGLLAGNVEVATLGVGVGVAAVLGTLAFRSLRGIVGT